MAPSELERRRRRRQQWLRKDRKESIGPSRSSSIHDHDLPDDLLRLILLQLDSPLWLIRAACVCKRWRRAIIADDGARAFLRLARSLHPPAVVGHYHNCIGGGYLFVPSSSPPAVGGSRRFSVGGCHSNYSSVADCHGGLVLLRMRHGPEALCVANLLVYDPLTGKYRWISSSRPRLPHEPVYCYGTDDTFFLLDGDDGSISISNFRVLYRLNNAAATGPRACVFSTANGGKWDWLFSIDDVLNRMEMQVLPEQTRNDFNYTLPWPQFLRAC